MNSFLIRKIKRSDNPDIKRIIRATFPEFDLPLEGTAFEDEELEHMFESSQDRKSGYFVAEENGNVVGGGGIKPLKGSDGSICELHKMYLSPDVRGKGYGKLLFNHCLEEAINLGYKHCYLESDSKFVTAIRIYEKSGFRRLNMPMGDTGHFACGVWMIKDL
jgi:putative acetyltransferase